MYEALSILLTFGIIIFLLRRKVSLGPALLTGTIALGLLSRMPPILFLNAVLRSLLSRPTIELILTVLFLGVLGHLLKATGSLQRMVDALQGLFRSKKVVMGLIPALIGLVVVPGAAIMSAPMIGVLGDDLHYSPDRKAAINLLFRHVWFPTFPLATSLISLAKIADINIFSIIRMNLPATVVGIIVSSVASFGLTAPNLGIVANPIPEHSAPTERLTGRLLRNLLTSTAPILIALLLSATRLLPYPLAIGLGILAGLQINRVSWSLAPAIFRSGLDYKIALTMAGVMVFKSIVDESGMVVSLVTSLTAIGVPQWALIITLPMIVALATGSSIAAVGIALPILMPLLATSPNFLPLLSLFYISCCTGYFFSPLHLCLILTNEYFQANHGRVIRIAAAPMLSMFVTAVAVCLLLWK